MVVEDVAAESGVKVLSEAEMALIKGGGSNIKVISKNILKEAGIDAHELKMEFLGKKAQIAHFDLYKETITNEILR